jgi:predicted amidohydrolase
MDVTSSHSQAKFRAAAVQAASMVRDAPDYFDPGATLDKAVSLVREAGRNGARLIVFPEGWLPCFAYFSMQIDDRPAFFDLWAKYLRASVEVPGPELTSLGKAAAKAGAWVVMGINERDARYRGRMYNTAVFIGPDGRLMGAHRKICNTVQERFFHTPGGGGANLKTVFPTDIGCLGATICGEHSQLLLLQNWAVQGIEVHCALWPGTRGIETVQDLKTRNFCDTAKCFGVLSAAYFPDAAMPKRFYSNTHFNTPGIFRGGSGIIGPNGQYIAGPVYDQETIVYGDIDLALIDRARSGLSILGSYNRWDILNLGVREEEYTATTALQGGGSERERMLEERVKALEGRLDDLAAKRPGPGGSKRLKRS